MPQDAIDYQPEAQADSALIDALEPDQLAAAAAQSLPRMQLSRSMQFWLWGLRVFVMIVTALVVYIFVVQLVREP